MGNLPTIPSPATGRPLTTVNEIHYALKSGAVYSELATGEIVQIYQARHKQGIFQVRLENNQWESTPTRVWAAKKGAEMDASPSGKIHVTRTPVGDRSLDELLATVFQEPVWIEAPSGDLVIFPQFVKRRLALKHWRASDRSLCTVKTFAELAEFMRGQENMGKLLDQDEHFPFRAWQIGTPTLIEVDHPEDAN